MSDAHGATRKLIIVDANVFISYLLKPDDKVGTINRTVRAVVSSRFELMVPEELLVELRRAPDLSTFAGRLPADRVEAFVTGTLETIGTMVSAPEAAGGASVQDPKDRYLLEAAFFNDIDILISEDKHLLALRQFLDRPRIMSPAEFVAEFDHE